MGLIADLVESFKAGFGSIQDKWTTYGDWPAEQVDRMVNAVVFLGQNITTTGPFALLPGGELLEQRLAEFQATARDDALSFARGLFDYWTEILNRALAVLNVDAPDNLEALRLGDPEVIQSLLRVQGAQAQARVAGAIGAINLVLAMGNSVSVIAEAASAGTVRSIAEAVQSWIWANGLGQLSSMGYQPQLDASVMPLLTRFYNQRSQSRIPSESDLIRFQLREVYEPVRRAELLAGESRDTFNAYMEQNGFSEYHADSFWAAHWFLPSIGQLNEMLHRGFIDQPEWERFVRFNDYDPSSIERLRDIIYSPFTRVDARRMASVGVLTDQELLEAYADVGYFAPRVDDGTGKLAAVMVPNPDFTVHKAQALVVWTKMFNALPILRARFRNGWITSEELRDELAATGLPDAQVQIRWEMLVKADKEVRTAPEKELTRALVVRAWKLRLISFPQALFLVQRMGYDEAEAELILRVQSLPDDPLAFVNTNLGARLLSGGGLGSGLGVTEGTGLVEELEG